jgi:hypothetical protein
MFVPHRKHITSPLRAQTVTAICRFVSMVYQYSYRSCEHYPLSCLSETGLCLRLQAEPTQLGPIDRASSKVFVYRSQYFRSGLCFRVQVEPANQEILKYEP